MSDERTGREPSTGELIAQLSQETSRLVRDEMRLAKAELTETGKRAGMGVGLFSGAGLFAFLGLATLVATGVLALDLVLPAWAAALIVAVVLFAIAGVAALMGKKQVDQVSPVPQRTKTNVQRDIAEVKEHKGS